MGCKSCGCEAVGAVCVCVNTWGAPWGPCCWLLKGLQSWCGQQSPSHSPCAFQSLLWAVAAPQLGSPLVWKSRLAHPWLIHQHSQGNPSVLSQKMPNCIPKLHSSPTEGLLLSLLCKAEKVTFIFWLSAAASTLKRHFVPDEEPAFPTATKWEQKSGKSLFAAWN